MAKNSVVFDPAVDGNDMYGYEESSFSIPKALSLFFGVVLMAGIFFGGGYHMGHTAALNQQAAVAPTPSQMATNYSAKEKPGAAVEAAPETATPAIAAEPEPVATQNALASAPAEEHAPKAAKAAAVAPSGTFAVQVAAVRHEEDAEALLGALRKKQYPVFLASIASDSLFHVQVGPFPTQKEAEATRARLAGDGYNAIVKK